MTTTSYYYDPPDSLNIVVEPGEVCNLCGELARIGKKGELVKLPSNAIHEEYGSRPDDIHGHLDCAERYLAELKREVDQLERNIAAHKVTRL